MDLGKVSPKKNGYFKIVTICKDIEVALIL